MSVLTLTSCENLERSSSSNELSSKGGGLPDNGKELDLVTGVVGSFGALCFMMILFFS